MKISRRAFLGNGAVALSSFFLPGARAQPLSTNAFKAFTWGSAMPYIAQTLPQTFIFESDLAQSGQFTSPNPMGAGTESALSYNSQSAAAEYAWQRPLAYGPAYIPMGQAPASYGPTNWDHSEFPTPDLPALQSRIYSLADQYCQSYCASPLSAATDQQKVASIIASLRDCLLINFTAPNLAAPGQAQDFAISNEINLFFGGQYKMMAIVANAINNTLKPGFKIQCTETAPILTYFLNGYGICARQWNVNFLYVDNGGATKVPVGTQILDVDSVPQHGTVEYFDTQFSKWVMVDLIYGVAGVIDDQASGSRSNLCGVSGVPLSLPGFISALASNRNLPVLWTPRNLLTSRGAWFTAIAGQDVYLAVDQTPAHQAYDPNGNAPMKSAFLAPDTPYSQYVTSVVPIKPLCLCLK